MTGLPIAMALGALVGKSEYELEVLKDADKAAVEAGCRLIDQKRISVDLKQNIQEKLYIEVEVKAGNDTALAIISGGHSRFVLVKRNDEVLFSADAPHRRRVLRPQLTTTPSSRYVACGTSP